MGILDGFVDAFVTPQAVGQKIGTYFTDRRITASDLRAAVRDGRSIVAEAAHTLPLASLPAATRQRVLAWGPTEYAAMLGALAVTHPEHKAVLYESATFYGYLVPEMDRAKAIIRAAAPPSGG